MRLGLFKKLLITMTVIGAAGAVIGAGTFASFNATVTNQNNTFATGALALTNQANAGTTCTQAGNAALSGTCATIGSISSNMKPGDSKFGTVSLKNDNGASPASTLNGTLGLTITAPTSSTLDSTAFGSGGLGLVLVRCAVACGTATSQVITPLYPASCTGSFTGGVALSSTVIATAVGADTVTIDGATCTPTSQKITQVSALNLGGPNTGNQLNAGSTDFIGVVVYLSYPSTGNAFQNLTTGSVLSFAWSLNQLAGTSQ